MVLPNPWQRGQAPIGLLKLNRIGSGVANSVPQRLARELLVEAQWSVAAGALEMHLARLAIADLDGVHKSLVQIGADRNAVHQDEQRLREVDVEQRLGRGELERPAALKQPVEALLAQLEQVSRKPRGCVFAAMGNSAYHRDPCRLRRAVAPAT